MVRSKSVCTVLSRLATPPASIVSSKKCSLCLPSSIRSRWCITWCPVAMPFTFVPLVLARSSTYTVVFTTRNSMCRPEIAGWSLQMSQAGWRPTVVTAQCGAHAALGGEVVHHAQRPGSLLEAFLAQHAIDLFHALLDRQALGAEDHVVVLRVAPVDAEMAPRDRGVRLFGQLDLGEDRLAVVGGAALHHALDPP